MNPEEREAFKTLMKLSPKEKTALLQPPEMESLRMEPERLEELKALYPMGALYRFKESVCDFTHGELFTVWDYAYEKELTNARREPTNVIRLKGIIDRISHYGFIYNTMVRLIQKEADENLIRLDG